MKIMVKNLLGLTMIGTFLFSLCILPLVFFVSPRLTMEDIEFIVVPFASIIIFYLVYKEKKYAGIIGIIIFGMLFILIIINVSFCIRTVIYVVNFITSFYYTIINYTKKAPN